MQTYHNIHITNLKAVAIIGVILTHLFVPSNICLNIIWAYAVRLAVPLFLITTGYLLTMSYERHRESLFTYYKYTLPSRLFALLLPFFVIAGIEFTLLYYTSKITLSFVETSKFFLLGGVGPGNYYIPLIIQIYLIYPLLRFSNSHHIILWGFISFVADYLVHLGFFNLALSHFICLRYLFFVATGVFCYQRGIAIKQNANFFLKLTFAIGIIIIALINFTPYHLLVYVPAASAPVVLFIGPLFIWIVNLPPVQINVMLRTILLWMGNNTWNIFLSQMFLFYIVQEIFPWQKQLFFSGIIAKFLFFIVIILFSFIFSFFIEQIQKFSVKFLTLLHPSIKIKACSFCKKTQSRR